MVPTGILLLMAGGLVVGAFLKLFSDHRAFRRELREVNEQLDTVLDVVSTIAIDPASAIRIDRVSRRVQRLRAESDANDRGPDDPDARDLRGERDA